MVFLEFDLSHSDSLVLLIHVAVCMSMGPTAGQRTCFHQSTVYLLLPGAHERRPLKPEADAHRVQSDINSVDLTCYCTVAAMFARVRQEAVGQGTCLPPSYIGLHEQKTTVCQAL